MEHGGGKNCRLALMARDRYGGRQHGQTFATTGERDGGGTCTRKPLPPDPDRWMPQLVRKLGPAARALWLMHEPTAGTPLSAPFRADRGQPGVDGRDPSIQSLARDVRP